MRSVFWNALSVTMSVSYFGIVIDISFSLPIQFASAGMFDKIIIADR
ncbi:MAG: hypothetical protein IPL16_07405 [Ignavibacteria bacterium]|nr:hypothetical protein [Ignavibacteria bacterium]